jgi:hypothetical protein
MDFDMLAHLLGEFADGFVSLAVEQIGQFSFL